MRSRRRPRALVGTLALVVALGTVAACGDNDDSTGAADKSVKVATDDAAAPEVTADQVTPGEDLPAGFPADAVPLIDEKVIGGKQGGPDGNVAWLVIMQTSRAVEDVAAEVKADFATAGYATAHGSDMGDVSVMNFTNDVYEVGVTAARSGGGVTVTYVVKNAG